MYVIVVVSSSGDVSVEGVYERQYDASNKFLTLTSIPGNTVYIIKRQVIV